MTIFLLWVALSNAANLAQLVIAVFLAICLPILTQRFWPEPASGFKPLPALKLIGILLWDILIANIDVAKLVLGPISKLKPAFIEVPLDMQDPFVATLLASMVSLTPGTVSIDIDRSRWVLQVHALNVDDVQKLIDVIKQRYEEPLKEIFSC